MNRLAIGFAVTLVLSGCVDGSYSPFGMSSLPDETVAGDYQILASCSFERIDRLIGPGFQKTDLPSSKSVRLSISTGGFRGSEITFADAGAKQTRISWRTPNSAFGPSTYSYNRLMPEIKSCIG